MLGTCMIVHPPVDSFHVHFPLEVQNGLRIASRPVVKIPVLNQNFAAPAVTVWSNFDFACKLLRREPPVLNGMPWAGVQQPMETDNGLKLMTSPHLL
mmetsp:Transcript_137968/g.384846  ORF Transcript_137968/g.384846 Transcript_137968/m.384846 type:complete len:97 (+) Transcript_137968:337-627(+)